MTTPTNERTPFTFQPAYNSSGLPIVEAVPGAELTLERHGNDYTIRGNAAGLIFLAQNLVALATMKLDEKTAGYHIHLDDLYQLNDKDVSVVLRIDT